MTQTSPVLYYIHDPMCSWCWGFRPVWTLVQSALHGIVNIQYVLGGLAPDTDQPMPGSMQQSIRSGWQRIQREVPGTEFNYDFWTLCKPRRSTYPACRAVIASRMQQPQSEKKMILAIQQAYYLQARNPSDIDVLIKLAGESGLDTGTFCRDIQSNACGAYLQTEIQLARDLCASSFPALVLSLNTTDIAHASESSIHIDYTCSDDIIRQVAAKLPQPGQN